MAGYYDYDSRPRDPRRNNEDYHERRGPSGGPAAGFGSANRDRGGQGVMDQDYATPRSYRHSSYDTRYFPPPPPPDNGRPNPPLRAPTTRRRHSWPPPVTCEDEATSLAKEAGAAKLLEDVGKDEAQSRGVIDQEPVIQDVPGMINKDERRFVLASDSEKEGPSTGIPTPPTSDEERVRKPSRRPSRLNTNFDEGVPELQRRTASPYAISQPTKLQKEASYSDRYLSPTALTPPPTETRRRRDQFSRTSKAPSPRRDTDRRSPNARIARDYFSAYASNDQAIVDDEWDGSDPTSRNRRDAPDTRRATDQLPKGSKHTAVVDFAPPPSNAPPIRRMNLDARRNTDSASSLPTLRVDKTRRPSPLMAAGAMTAAALTDFTDSAVFSAPGTPSGMDLPVPRSRGSSYMSSRGVSSSASASAGPSPPRSNRESVEYSRTNTSGSSHSSTAGSASASRPASPSPRTPADTSRLPKTDLDWSTLLAANAARKAQPPSRLATSMTQDSVPHMPYAPLSTGPSRPANSLPYPDEVGPGTPTMYMPSERDHQYFAPPPQQRPNLAPPAEAKEKSRAASPAGSNVSYTSIGSRPSRPPLPTRHSIANVSPTEERPGSSGSLNRRRDSFTTSSQTKRELTALLRKGLPDCPRPEPVAGHDDWYTVIGAPALTFCPDCVDGVFERTIYRPSIRRLPQLNFNSRVGCAFGSSPWLRLAWLLTLQRQRTDLTLLKDIGEVEETSEPCPGGREAVRSWYGLRDTEGYFIRDFHICYADVRKIERLLPTLNGFFVRLPQRASYGKYICGIRAEGNRFSTYLDALIATHERALASRKGADPMPFIKLVEHKTRLRECTKDNMLIGGLWHFAPSVPSLTVCEDCYESVVDPEARKNNDVAMRFNRTVQPVYGEGMGSSCQLYSRRMRKAFQRAVQDNDPKYLARKSKERREAELRLQERYKDVQRRCKRLSRDGGISEDEEWRLNRELERITEEWQDKWE